VVLWFFFKIKIFSKLHNSLFIKGFYTDRISHKVPFFTLEVGLYFLIFVIILIITNVEKLDLIINRFTAFSTDYPSLRTFIILMYSFVKLRTKFYVASQFVVSAAIFTDWSADFLLLFQMPQAMFLQITEFPLPDFFVRR
jgi:hypothetical protein